MNFYYILEKINGVEKLYKEIQSLNKQLSHFKKNEADNAQKIAEKNKKIESLLAQAEQAKSALMKELGEVSGLNIKKAVAIIETILHQRQVEFGLVAKEKEEDAREKVLDLPDAIKHLEEYQKYASPGVYHALLPYSELAYLFEENGIAQEHAFKLAVLFQDRSKALSYVEAFAKQQKKGILESPDFDLLHDALLFSLPPIECDFKRWRQLAQANMQEPDFRKLLPSAKEIEKAIQLGEGMRRGKEVEDNLQILKTELSVKLKQWKELKAHHEKTKQDQKKEKEYHALTQEISELRVELVGLYAGIPWDKASYEMIRCYYERYITQESKVFNYFLQNGLTRQDYFEKFLKLNRAEASKNMPRITPEMTGAVRDEANPGHSRYVLDGSAWGFPGFYLKQIDPLNDEEAAIAACGGILTGCCQSLSGEAGESCVKHGLTSPNGGFYALCEGNPKRPKAEDKVWGLTWAWRSKKNQVVFDSIEMHRDLRDQVVGQGLKGKEMALTMLSGFAAEIVQKTDIVAVNSGKGSGISSIFGRAGGEVQGFIDYDGYSDAGSQNIIAHHQAPFLLWGKILSKEGYEWFAKSLKAFLLKNVASVEESSLMENEPLKQAIEFSAIHEPELISLIKETSGSTRTKEIDAYFSQLNQLAEAVDQIRTLGSMEQQAKQRVSTAEHNLRTRTDQRRASLKKMVDDAKKELDEISVRTKEKLAKIEELLNNVNPNIIFTKEETILIVAITTNNLPLLQLLLSIDKININQVNAYGDNALMVALKNKANKEIIELLLKRKEIDLTQVDKYGNNALMVALRNEANKEIIEMLLKREEIDLTQINKHGNNALMAALKHSANNEIIEMLLKRKEINLAQADINGDNAMQIAYERRNITIIKLLLQREEFSLPITEEMNVLELAFYYGVIDKESLKAFLLRKEIHSEPSVTLPGNILLLAVRFTASKELIEELLQNEKINLNHVDKYGKNVLMYALEHPSTNKNFIENLLKRKKLDFSQIDKDGNNALMIALKYNTDKEIISTLLKQKFLFDTTPFLDIAIINKKPAQELRVLSDFWLTQIQQDAISIDRADPLGNTLLFYAVRMKDKSLISQLLALGADPNKKCNDGKSPLEIGQPPMIDWLNEKIKEREIHQARVASLQFSPPSFSSSDVKKELAKEEIKWSEIKVQIYETYQEMLKDKNTPWAWDEDSQKGITTLKEFCDKQEVGDAKMASVSLSGLTETAAAFKNKTVQRKLQTLIENIEKSIIRESIPMVAPIFFPRNK